jgi:glycine/D-amino acid oxidase-like deaminating enzyme
MEVDYLILGAGITGLSCATWLNHLGKNKILIMDRDHTRSAFSRNAGFLTSGSAQFALSLKQRFGVDKAKELWELTNSNHDELSQFIHRHKLEHKIGFRKAGSVTLLDRELTVSELDFLGQLGIQAIDQTFFDCASAFYDPWEASFDSFLFIKEWERALLEKGVALLKEDVVEVSRAKGLWLINDKLKAKNLIIANNRSSSFLPKEYAHFHPMIQAVRAQMIEVDAPKGFKHHANFYLPEEKVYFRLSNDRLILGGKRLVDEEAEYTEDFGSNPVLPGRY